MKRSSVSDVSRRAGVSTATVSRVLNAPERVAEGTRKRVLEAIDELNFVKSAAALSLKSQRSNNVLIVVNGVGNIFYSEIFEGAQRRAEANGYNVIITGITDEGGHDQILERLRTGRVDGVIMLDGFKFAEADYELLYEIYHGTPPIVGFSEKPEQLHHPHVFIDNCSASYNATRYLIEKGHTKIGHIMGPERLQVTSERLAGFEKAMGEARLEIRRDWILPGRFDPDGGSEAAKKLLALKDMPTAMFCCTDEVAMGLISELARAGVAVPGDLSVMGFDNIALSEVYSPPLTTMAQPRHRIGEATIDLLLGIVNQRISGNRVVQLDVELIERESVAAPRS